MARAKDDRESYGVYIITAEDDSRREAYINEIETTTRFHCGYTINPELESKSEYSYRIGACMLNNFRPWPIAKV